jgi:hypothetical protein
LPQRFDAQTSDNFHFFFDMFPSKLKFNFAFSSTQIYCTIFDTHAAAAAAGGPAAAAQSQHRTNNRPTDSIAIIPKKAIYTCAIGKEKDA